ncbi:MAG: DUF805 domain-containing protein [Alphaproteobacteria bacterium]|nr:DUF805 domain-containing protein [Alphaproteobacteria bacterium]
MNINELKDFNTVKEIAFGIAEDLLKEVEKVKNVNKENFITGFNKCFINYLKNEYVKFDGRVSRCQYWMFAIYSILIGIAISLIAFILPFLSILSTLYFLGILVPSVGISVRRLHDINLSGYWFLLSLIPYLGFVAVVFLFAIRGDNKANDFGPKVKK